MKKNCLKYWTKTSLMIMLLLSFLSNRVTAQKNLNDDSKKSECKFNTAPSLVKQISSSDVQKNRQKLVHRYAKLLVEHERLQEKLELLKLQTAGMLINEGETSDKKTLQKAVLALKKQRELELKVAKELDKLKKLATKELNSSEKSNELHQEFDDRLEALKVILQYAGTISSLVARRDGKFSQRDKGQVLKKNDALKVVVLSVGSLSGVKVNETWKIIDKDKVLAEVLIVKTRQLLSAAVVVNGKFKTIQPGMVVRLKSMNVK